MGTNQSIKKEDKNVALHYMQTLVDVARESFLILDSGLRVISGNKVFYDIFQSTPDQTENKFLYELGNGQWNIPQLRNLLGKILPEKKIVKNYNVSHVFENIGQKTMQLNAKQIDSVQLIILAIEDVTVKKNLEAQLAKYTKDLELKVMERTKDLNRKVKELEGINRDMVGRELKMVELKKEIEDLKKQLKKQQ
jgi:hypothetical protein